MGELCHFLDFACFFAEGPPVRVSAESLGVSAAPALADSVVVQVLFECGSVASIQYLANGDSSLRKERIEVFAGGVVGLIDDFRELDLVRDGRRKRERARRSEKGHREEMAAFVDLATGAGGEALSPPSAFWSSALTLGVVEAHA